MGQIGMYCKNGEFDEGFLEEPNYIAQCTFCGEENVTKGGFWHTRNGKLIVCTKCSREVIDLLIDTLVDTEALFELTEEKQLELIISKINDRLIKKREIQHKWTNKKNEI